ncbi:MAG: SURF1 family protein [Burkholderiales bacterium]|nr:SURF1 family protein [Burkholderiales bacterium]
MSRPIRRLLLLISLTAMMCTLTFNLGQWQTRRAEQKTDLENRREAAVQQAPLSLSSPQLEDPQALQFRHVLLEGEFIAHAWVALDNRQHKAAPAVSLIQAFRVQPGGFVVVVDRGLLLRDPASPRALPAIPENLGQVRIEGLILDRFPRSAELWGLKVKDASSIHRNGREWSNFDMNLFASEYSLEVGNFVVQQLSDTQDGLKRVPPQWSSEVGKHKGYAFQWYSLTALLLVFSFFLCFKEWQGTVAKSANLK